MHRFDNIDLNSRLDDMEEDIDLYAMIVCEEDTRLNAKIVC